MRFEKLSKREFLVSFYFEELNTQKSRLNFEGEGE